MKNFKTAARNGTNKKLLLGQSRILSFQPHSKICFNDKHSAKTG